MMLSLDTAYRSFGGEVEASSTPTICRLSDSPRHQLSAIALGRHRSELMTWVAAGLRRVPNGEAVNRAASIHKVAAELRDDLTQVIRVLCDDAPSLLNAPQLGRWITCRLGRFFGRVHA